VTNRCNLDCVICNRDRQFSMEREFPADLIDEIADISRHARETVLFGYGEPLLSGQFFSLLRRVRSGRVSFTTNGLLMSEKIVRRILHESPRPIYSVTFSIDASARATYRSIRRGPDLEQIWGNLAALAEGKRRRNTAWPEIWINFVAMRRNVGELPELIRRAAGKEVSRINVFHLIVWDPSYQEESLLHYPELADQAFKNATRAKPQGMHLDLPAVITGRPAAPLSTPLPRCSFPWSYAYIRCDGTVQGCCYSDNLVMGNLREKNFTEIWNGEAFRRLRRTVNSKPPADCMRCDMRFRYTASPDDRKTYLRF
jgi:MoaA/NifB/PqqE/SkfB family radical SAM enzyme